jgi:hypothetical protein
VGPNRWSLDTKPGRFGGKRPERKKKRETFFSITEEEESSEG